MRTYIALGARQRGNAGAERRRAAENLTPRRGGLRPYIYGGVCGGRGKVRDSGEPNL